MRRSGVDKKSAAGAAALHVRLLLELVALANFPFSGLPYFSRRG